MWLMHWLTHAHRQVANYATWLPKVCVPGSYLQQNPHVAEQNSRRLHGTPGHGGEIVVGKIELSKSRVAFKTRRHRANKVVYGETQYCEIWQVAKRGRKSSGQCVSLTI